MVAAKQIPSVDLGRGVDPFSYGLHEDRFEKLFHSYSFDTVMYFARRPEEDGSCADDLRELEQVLRLCAAHDVRPVSYTHLDVYKRQMLGGSLLLGLLLALSPYEPLTLLVAKYYGFWHLAAGAAALLSFLRIGRKPDSSVGFVLTAALFFVETAFWMDLSLIHIFWQRLSVFPCMRTFLGRSPWLRLCFRKVRSLAQFLAL